MPKLTHVDANNMHLTYVYTSIQSHKNAPSSLSIILCIHIITSQHSCPSYIIFSRSMTTNSVNSVKVVLRLRMTYLGHLRAIAPTGMIN